MARVSVVEPQRAMAAFWLVLVGAVEGVVGWGGGGEVHFSVGGVGLVSPWLLDV